MSSEIIIGLLGIFGMAFSLFGFYMGYKIGRGENIQPILDLTPLDIKESEEEKAPSEDEILEDINRGINMAQGYNE